MKKNVFGGKRLAMVSALTLCLGLALALTLVKRGNAFTLIELLVKFNPVEITPDQTSHVVFNNTFGQQEIHATVNWGDATTGAPIGLPYMQSVMPGHGFIAILPAVQTTGNQATGNRAIIVVCRLTPAPGTTSLPYDTGNRIGATLEVVERATGHVTLAQNLSTVPAVQ